jgi:hypothetical protein
MSGEPVITVNPQTGLVKIHGIPICKRLITPDGVVLTVKPRCKNSRKARQLGHKPAVVTLSDFVRAVSE